MVEQMSELVEKAECDAVADSRYPHVDWILHAKPVSAGLRDRRGRAHGHRCEVRKQTVETRRGRERTLELDRERTSSRQRNQFFECAQPRFAFARNATRVLALSHGANCRLRTGRT